MSEPPNIASLSFEQALAELESIVQELESGQAPLERSIEMYERGALLKIVVGPQGGAERTEPAEFS
jgi:exodeoxyribonuclease VII small subunit